MVVDAVWLESSKKPTTSLKHKICEQGTKLTFTNLAVSQLFKRCVTAVRMLKGKYLIHFLESTVCEITGPVGVLESSKLSVSEAYAQHSSGVDWWVTGCACELRTSRAPPQPPTFSALLSSSVYPSLPPLTLTMALGRGEWTTEVNAPRRRGVIVYETEVKMSGWNRQIKEMGEEVDVWRERLERDWHMSEKERERTWELQFESAMIFFFFLGYFPFFCCGISPLTTHYSDHYWHLLHKLLIAPTFKYGDKEMTDFGPTECLVKFFECPCIQQVKVHQFIWLCVLHTCTCGLLFVLVYEDLVICISKDVLLSWLKLSYMWLERFSNI